MSKRPSQRSLIFDGERVYREVPPEDGLTCADFASLIDVSDDTVRRWVRKGTLSRLPQFREIRIPIPELHRFLAGDSPVERQDDS